MNKLNCPNCSSGMETTVKYQVEIDYCPTCKGVWLDRGEIDKIAGLEKKYSERGDRKHSYMDEDDEEGGWSSRGRNNRRGGFLGELFGGFGGDD